LQELSDASEKKAPSHTIQQCTQPVRHMDRFHHCLLSHLFAEEGVSISVMPSYNLYIYRDMAEE